MLLQLPCGSSFMANFWGSWLVLSWKVGPVRRESTSLSSNSCRRVSSPLLMTALEANLTKEMTWFQDHLILIASYIIPEDPQNHSELYKFRINTDKYWLFFWILLASHPVGIGSEAEKYIWIMKAWTEALLTAGALPGPERAEWPTGSPAVMDSANHETPCHAV